MNPRALLPIGLGALLATAVPLPSAQAADGAPAKLSFQVAMRDGVKLATDVYLPDTNAAQPVILVRTPYNKAMGAGLAKDAAKRGYAIVAQDVRGRFESEGDNLPFDQDGPDGEDTIDWMAQQRWCNGRIGTWGGSAGAITQFQLAAAGTRHLGCQHLIVGAANLYEVVYSGGIFRKALVEDWLRGTKFSSNALPRWTSHPLYDAYWRERDAARQFPRINAPAVHIGGYWDIFAQSSIDAFVGYQTRGGPKARGQQKLIMGPWTHGVLQTKAGEWEFPNAKKPPGDVQDAWRWFDHWLRDQDNGVTEAPAVTYYVLGDVTDTNAPGNLWRTASQWPPLPAVPTTYYLDGGRGLSTEQPPAHEPLTYTYDPRDPVPTVGGVELTLPAGPKEQSKVEARPDVLVFTSSPLTAPLEITGRVRAKLYVSSDAPDTDFFVRLCDVYPDGKSYNICDGRLRARFRQGLDREALLKPGVVYPLDIDLWSTSIIFNTGHRLRVHVTSSSAPGFDPNPNTGDPFRANDQTRVANNAIHVGPGQASHLLLPVVRAGASVQNN